MIKTTRKDSWLERILLWSVVLITLYIPFHAFFSVSLGVVSHYPLFFKSWKEGALIIVAVIATVLLFRQPEARRFFLRSLVNQLALAFVLLHGVTAVFLHGSLLSTLAGLAIDTRYALFFLVVRASVMIVPRTKAYMIKAFGVGATVVVGFGVLQQYVLPADILSAVGYSKATIAPYLTVDNNPAFIRINSTLRGPNPLGAYVMAVILVIIEWTAHRWKSMPAWQIGLKIVAALAALSVLYASYSRSAWIGLAIGGIIIGLLSLPRQWLRPALMVLLVIVAAAGVGYGALKDTSFVRTVVVHNDPATANEVDSNLGHLTSVEQASRVVMTLPLGAGVGSTGSASLLGSAPLIVENQYLFVAHEVGWIGLIIFGALVFVVQRDLLRARSDWLARAWFAAGVGLLVIGLLLPVFVDDTVAYLWWGLAAALLPVTIVGKVTNKTKT